MTELQGIAKLLIGTGLILVIAGIILLAYPRIPFLGKLPGDIFIKRENFTFFFPIVSSVAISAIISILIWIFRSK